MSSIRQNTLTANDIIHRYPDHTLVSRLIMMEANEHDKPHSHQWHQVIYAKRGLLRTHCGTMHYVIPADRAVLIPAHSVHESWAISKAEFIGIYLNPTKVSWNVSDCRIIRLSSLVRELMHYIAQEINDAGTITDSDSRLINVFCDQLAVQQDDSLQLILPTDKRLTRITERLLNDPANNESLSDWAATVGASERTISRNFSKQTGLNFSKWRQRMKLISSLRYLEQRIPIEQIAYSIGYNSASAYIHSFRQVFKITPQQYFNP